MWKYKGTAGWHFVTLPKLLSKKIRQAHGLSEEGWGRLKTKASIENTSWQTAIWYDSKSDSYLLPIKSDIRKKFNLLINSELKIHLSFKAESSGFLKSWKNS